MEEFLIAKNVPFESFTFDVSDEENGRAEAEKLQLTVTTIYKTLVLKGNKTGTVIALVPLDGRLDYKKTAKASGNRKVGFPPMEYVLAATGYPHGANTPIGIFMQHPDYVQIFDTSILAHEEVIVSSGELGHSVKVQVNDLLTLIAPIQADILSA
ncbi:YbaK/EbsC protein [Enterococcus dispar]|nr:YbaK/EbsC protein [Enterococcus dispar]